MRSLIAILLLLFIFSCSKENTEPKAEAINPLGSWSLFKVKLKSSNQGPLERDTTMVPCFKDVKMVFYDGGTVIARYVGQEYCMTRVTEGTHLGWSQSIPDQYGTWVKSTDTLTVVMNNQINDPKKFKLSIQGKKEIMGFVDPTEEYVTEYWYTKE